MKITYNDMPRGRASLWQTLADNNNVRTYIDTCENTYTHCLASFEINKINGVRSRAGTSGA